MSKNYFPDEELKCNCGECDFKFSHETRAKLNTLRENLGFALHVSSGYRCPEYNRKIGATQTHATGQAVDIACSHAQAFKIVTKAREFGFTGIGINQKGTSRFIHLDDLDDIEGKRPRPHIWSY